MTSLQYRRAKAPKGSLMALGVVMLAVFPIHPTLATPGQEPTVSPPAGPVRGRSSEGVDSFKGVPFAAPPVGALRWRAPQDLAPWSQVRDAVEYGADCMQLPFPSDAAPLGAAPAEDCLYLNVWRPAGTKAGERLPVAVWIYGGGFVNGGSSPAVYEGTALARQGMVFVSLNYRLGRFGFFQHPAISNAHEGPVGNWGLMDQHAALRWVQRNIAAFGGDPKKVTVIGESAGGMSVLHLLGTPDAMALASRAVVMSGGGRTRSIAYPPGSDILGRTQAEAAGLRFAQDAGISGTGNDALAALRALPAERVIDGLNLASILNSAKPSGFTGPIVDGVTVLDSTPALVERDALARMPLMIGATSADVGLLGFPDKDALFAGFGPREAEARKVYDPDGTLDLKALQRKIGGERMMLEPARHVARRRAAKGQPTWYYRFSYVAGSMRERWPDGAPHATEIPYFLGNTVAKYGVQTTPQDLRAEATASSYLGAFVRTGAPNVPDQGRWPAYDGKAPLLDMLADGTAKAGPDAWEKRLDLAASLREPGQP